MAVPKLVKSLSRKAHSFYSLGQQYIHTPVFFDQATWSCYWKTDRRNKQEPLNGNQK